MVPKLVIGDASIYNGDCLSAFSSISADSIDLIATDPPYFIDGMGDDWSDTEIKRKEARSGVVGGMPVGMKFDPEQGRRLERFFKKVSVDAIRVLKPGGFMVAFSQGRLYHRLAVAAEDSGFEVHDMLIWEHDGGQGKAFTQNHFVQKMDVPDGVKDCIIEKLQGRKTPQLRPKFEAMLLAQKPKQGTFVENCLKWNTGLIRTDFGCQQTTVFNFKKQIGARGLTGHITTKPTDLMMRIIEVFTVAGQTVLDPFMGSGTTGVAALLLSRSFIGFEIDKGCFNTAMRRLATRT